MKPTTPCAAIGSRSLVDVAQDLLDRAQERLPLPTNRRWRALTKAQGIFHGMLRKHDFPQPRRSPAPSDVLEEETPA
ncbi:MAG: hypothetical protein KatS3mg124_0821 [Porticoccaceae bacterium]|nr:MAG: hypothetical protein KatS3mg124_0821 [Porticoccaceae bacterium]